ncbi:MAG: Uma2 family endonuclease [Thermoflexales bacterium]|nr:Uma2 family endonuclease [Thermoflexales bacterium]
MQVQATPPARTSLTDSVVQDPQTLMVPDPPCEDGVPLENVWHRLQINLLYDCVHQLWRGRDDFFVGGNMFVYFRADQVERLSFKGPDVFVVKDVDGQRVRPCWKAWLEGGRLPDLVVELLSESTRAEDLGRKKQIYEQTLRVREYVCFGPDPTQECTQTELYAWRLPQPGERYQPLVPDARGWVWSEVLGAWLGVWEGEYGEVHTQWLRLYDQNGALVPTRAEAEYQRAEAERQRAEAERQRAEAERQRAEAAEQQLQAERLRLAQIEARLRELGIQL